ncbi:MAG TPA: zinc ribbon domain-containing protein [Candidatus Obscuribacterales bacterium]
MAYATELYPGQQCYVHNAGDQTVVTLASMASGQQQQASTSLMTGSWTAPPRFYRTQQGGIIQLATTQGDRYLCIQGTSLQLLAAPPAIADAQALPLQWVDDPVAAPMKPMASIPPMTPMQPMRPLSMQMGNMQMSMQPMEMRMGDMTLRAEASASSSPTPSARRFCSQCGAPVQASDRFCAACGHALGG